MNATEAAIFATPVRVGNTELIASTELARLEDDAAHLRAIIDITRAKNKQGAVAIVAAKTEQLKRAYSTLDHIARLLNCSSFDTAQAVERLLGRGDRMLTAVADRAAIERVAAPILKPVDPGDTDIPFDIDAEGGLAFERARR